MFISHPFCYPGSLWIGFASVAQLAEQVTFNHWVVGSSPTRGTRRCDDWPLSWRQGVREYPPGPGVGVSDVRGFSGPCP